MASIGIWLALKGFMGVGRMLSFSQSLIQTDFLDPVSPVKNAGCFGIIPKHSIDPQSQQRLPEYAPRSAAAYATKENQDMIDKLLKGNEKFRNTTFKDHKELYSELVKGQQPPVLWIGCSDSRLQTGHITGTQAGTLFMHRNIGNMAPANDWSLATVLEYGIKHLKVQHIVICGHSDCGAMKALDKDLEDVYVPNWLNNAVEAKKRVDARIKKPSTPNEQKERSRKIEQENVRLQIEHLRTYPIVAKAEKEKKIEIHGMYYDLETGALTKIV
jgi:carbonic anhydrase